MKKSELKILIIDDNPADANLLKRLLNKMPLWETKVATAFSGSDGQKLNKSFDADILFVDYLLGSENGIDVISEIRKSGTQTPAILLTGYGSEKVVTNALRAGASDYLNKNELTLESTEKTIRHIIQRRNDENKLKQTELRLQQIIENTDTGFAILDQKGFIVSANNAFLKLAGQENENLVLGRHVSDWTTGDNQTDFIEAIEKCASQGTLTDFETYLTNSKQQRSYVLVNATAECNETEKQISILFRNITERKLYEEKLKIAKIKAEEADRLKSAFLANLSHEIRTPMNAIMGFANILSEPDIDDTQKNECITHINTSSKTLLNLIEDIIDISKIVAQQIEVVHTGCQINSMMDKLFEQFSERKEKNGKENIELSLKKSNPDPDFAILTDPFRLNQILSNLLDNAIKFTEEGFIEFGYHSRDDKNIEFYVRDTGIGISEEKQLLIFDWFRKIDDNNKKIYRGSGIGLTISRSLTGLLGGELKVQSAPGVGSMFFFAIPLIQVKQDERDKKPVAKVKTYTKNQGLGKTVLIVEDEETNFRLLKAALLKFGMDIIWTKNGIEAVEICKNQDIDVVLMDIKMPGMNGYEATEKIKKIKPNLPIIAQTAYAMTGEKEGILEAGCDAYLSKPINLKDLNDLLDKYIFNP